MNRRGFLSCLGCASAAAFAGCTGPQARGTNGAGMSTQGPKVQVQDLAYCGVDCAACDVLKATIHGDDRARERALKVWTKTAQEHWGMATLDPAILRCRGCRTEGADIFRGCRRCPMRRCARERNLSSCGLCPQWRACLRLSSLLADAPGARKNLEAVAKDSDTSTQATPR